MWRVITTDLNKLNVSPHMPEESAEEILANYLSNEELYEATGSTTALALIRVRRWRWIGHILRTSPGNISRTALRWPPEGKRRRGPPRETWRKKPAGMAFVGGRGRIGGRPGWMAQFSSRPEESSWAR